MSIYFEISKFTPHYLTIFQTHLDLSYHQTIKILPISWIQSNFDELNESIDHFNTPIINFALIIHKFVYLTGSQAVCIDGDLLQIRHIVGKSTDINFSIWAGRQIKMKESQGAYFTKKFSVLLW